MTKHHEEAAQQNITRCITVKHYSKTLRQNIAVKYLRETLRQLYSNVTAKSHIEKPTKK